MEEPGADANTKVPLLEASGDDAGDARSSGGGQGQVAKPRSSAPRRSVNDRRYRAVVKDEDQEQTEALVKSQGADDTEDEETPQASGARSVSGSCAALSMENLSKLDQTSYDETWLRKKTGRSPGAPPDLATLPPPPSLPSHDGAGAEETLPILPPQPDLPGAPSASTSSAAKTPPKGGVGLSSGSSPSSGSSNHASPSGGADQSQPARTDSQPKVPHGAAGVALTECGADLGSGEITRQDSDDAEMSRSGSDRHCFMCLQEGESGNPLVPCCTTCYARVHVRCWKEWRNSQRITALRSRLLGTRTPSNNLLRCTICKSGTAVVRGEEHALEWMNDMLCNTNNNNNNDPGRWDDSDAEGDGVFEELTDTKTCIALVVYLSVLVVVLLTTCILIFVEKFDAYDGVLCCIIALYELSIMQIVGLAIVRRRSAMLAAASQRVDSREHGDARELPMGP